MDGVVKELDRRVMGRGDTLRDGGIKYKQEVNRLLLADDTTPSGDSAEKHKG